MLSLSHRSYHPFIGWKLLDRPIFVWYALFMWVNKDSLMCVSFRWERYLRADCIEMRIPVAGNGNIGDLQKLRDNTHLTA